MEVELGNKLRLKLLLLFFLLLMMVVLFRLFQIQIIDSAYYRTLAEKQQIRKVELKGRRGDIYDRNGVLLATMVQGRSFAFEPQVIRKDTSLVKQFYAFAKLLGITEEQIRSILKTKRNFQWLRRGIMDYSAILDTFDFPGLVKTKEPRRFYLFGRAFSNVIGVTNIDNRGISGIELSLDSILRGSDGYEYFLRDARGRLIPSFELPKVEPVDGKDIQLTIDNVLQGVASYYLREGVERTLSKGGCVIAMNPQSGEILALASYPNFDPNNSQSWNDGIYQNYATNYLFEPGSTIKPIIAAISLQRKITSAEEIFEGFNGKLKIGDVEITDEHPTSRITLEEAIVFSSNIVFSQIASRIPSEILIGDLQRFGFKNPTRIGVGVEPSGNLPNVKEISSIQQKFLGFGYGISFTPIQLATAFCVLANGGRKVLPKVLLGQSNRNELDTIIQSDVANEIKKMLVEVVERGTGMETKIEGLTIAGKTGTAQKFIDGSYSKSGYINTFVGFFPVDNPKMLILVMLDEPKSSIYASSTVVPIFKNIVLTIYNSPYLRKFIN